MSQTFYERPAPTIEEWQAREEEVERETVRFQAHIRTEFEFREYVAVNVSEVPEFAHLRPHKAALLAQQMDLFESAPMPIHEGRQPDGTFVIFKIPPRSAPPPRRLKKEA